LKDRNKLKAVQLEGFIQIHGKLLSFNAGPRGRVFSRSCPDPSDNSLIELLYFKEGSVPGRFVVLFHLDPDFLLFVRGELRIEGRQEPAFIVFRASHSEPASDPLRIEPQKWKDENRNAGEI
jgi:hypothetical protein